MILDVDLELQSESNIREHWAVKRKRHKSQSILVRKAFTEACISFTLPVQIILTRISPRKLDNDNLVSAFKNIRDEIADILIPGKKRGHADNSNQLRWFYDQRKPLEKNEKKKIRIEINSLKK